MDLDEVVESLDFGSRSSSHWERARARERETHLGRVAASCEKREAEVLGSGFR